MTLKRKSEFKMRKRTRVDSRKRVSIGSVLNSYEEYDVFEHKDGTIMLTPRVSIPANELWLHKNSATKASVLQGLKDSATGKLVKKSSLSAHADDEIE